MDTYAFQIVNHEEDERERQEIEQEKKTEEKQRILLQRLNELKRRQESADLRVSYLLRSNKQNTCVFINPTDPNL